MDFETNNFEMNTNGAHCEHCGDWIQDGTAHVCWDDENVQFTPTVRDFMCPNCNGEFNFPGGCEEHGYVCPWCKRKMEGI